MEYEIDYQSALAKAKQENKPIMMVIGTKTCPWCRKFESQTLKKKMIHNKVATNFIPLSLTKDVDKYPAQFDAKVVPTIFFINPHTQESYFISRGYQNKHKFKETLQQAIQSYKGDI
jgi:predicted bacteriocin transport accessory protein